MKKVFVIILIVFSITANAQEVDSLSKSHSIVQPVLSDSSLLYTNADMKLFFETLGEKIKLPNGTTFQITGNERDRIAYIFNQLIQARAVQRWKTLNFKK